MSEVEVRPDVDLNELYDQDVPCGTCGNSAQLRSMGHQVNDCGRSSTNGEHPPYFKCIQCWQAWVTERLRKLASGGYLRCGTCQRTFTTVESFSDYRPF